MKITTIQQFETLVSEMEKAPAYAKGFRKGIKPLNFNSFWRETAEKLNPLGPLTFQILPKFYKLWYSSHPKLQKKFY